MFAKLKKLIQKRFYADRETAIGMVDTALIMKRITQEQAAELYMLIDEYYPEPNSEVE